MTNSEMLFKLRGWVDEASADFYADATDLYGSLTDAQLEITKQLADNWKLKSKQSPEGLKLPVALMPLRTVEADTINSGLGNDSLTGSPIQVTSVQWQSDGSITASSPYAVELSDSENSFRLLQNSLLSTGIYYWWTSSNIFVRPLSTDNNATYSITFIDTPVDITSGVQPEIGAVAHDAVIERAAWILLKDRESEQAQVHLQLYAQLLEGLKI